MQYEVIGGNLPAAIVKLQKGQSVYCESGSMSWMTDGITMKTEGGGIGKVFGRAFSGENIFRNKYVAEKDGEIAFSSSFPGEIRGFELNGNSVIAQKGSYLASDEGIDTSIHFQKKISGGFFSGEGFIMQKFSGNGTVLIEIDGSAKEYQLAAGEKMIMDTGYLVCMDETCSLEIQSVKGVKNVLFGGEGLFNTVVTGPGRVIVQSMPIVSTAAALAAYLNLTSNN
ncbi:MAG: TIGR00266 family protein [Lachnospiraceae bacterium]|nr:TIGR00266 family protein [Lachnospiraceae bacterium]